MNEKNPDRDSREDKKLCHVLVLEDDLAHVDMIRRIFSKTRDEFRVTFAQTVNEAEPVLKNDPPDLIIADWQLPDGRGIDIMPRKDGKVTTPLVIMTGRGNEQLAVEVMKSGAIDYVVKSEVLFRDLPHLSKRALKEWDNIVKRKAAEKKAQEATEKYRHLTENIDAIILNYDLNGNILFMNTVAASLVGGDPIEFIGKPVQEVFSRQFAVMLFERLQEIRENPDKSVLYEDRVTFPTGTYWILSRFSPELEINGEVSGVYVISTDITKKKEAEQKSLEVRKRLEDILDFLPDATLAIDNRGTVIAWNRAMEIMTGVPAKEMLGKGDYEYSIPFYGYRRPILADIVIEGKEEIKREYEEIQRDGKTITSEVYSTRCYGGKGAFLWGKASPLYDAAGDCTGAIEVIRDITQRRGIERALFESEARYRTLIETSPDAIGLIDIDGLSLFANNRAASLFGYASAEELIGMNITSLITPKEGGQVRDFLKELKERGEVSAIMTAIRKDQTTFPGEVYSKAIYDATGKPKYAMVVLHDLSRLMKAEEALRESEERFRSYVENANDIIYSLALDGRLTYVSPKWTELLGHDTSEVIGQLAEKFIHPDDIPRCREAIGEAIRTGRKQPEIEYRVRHKNGSWQWHTQNGAPIADAKGNIISYLGIARDITERKSAEDALRESEKKFRNVLENIPDMVWVHKNGLIVYVNPALVQMLGITEDQALHTSLMDYIAPEYYERVIAAINERMAAHQIDPYEIEIFSPDGIRRNVIVRGTLIEYDGIPASLNVLTDVTDLKKTEVALRESEKRFRELSDLLPQGVFEADANGILTYANRIAFEMFGYPEEILEKRVNILTMIAPDDRDRIAMIFYEMMSGGSPPLASDEFKALRRDGSTFPLSIYSSPIIHDGQIIGVRGITIDITERKRAEESLRASEARYLNIIEDQTEFICRFKPDGTHVFINDAYASYFGKPREELIGEIFRPNIFPGDREMVRKFFASLTPAHPVDNIEHRIIMPDGTIRWQRWSERAIFDSTGAVIEYQSVGRDTTEQKKVEESLRESEARYRDLFGNMYAGVAIFEAVGNGEDFIFKDINSAVERIEKVTRDEIIGHSVLEVFPGVIEFGLFEVLQRVWKTGATEQHPLSIYKDDRMMGWRDNTIYKLPSGEIVTIYEDVTGKKQAEEDRRTSEARLEIAMGIGNFAWWEMELPSGNVKFHDRKATMLGYSPDQFRTFEDFTALLHPEDYPRTMKAMRDHLEGRLPVYNIEYRIRKNTGDYRWFHDVGGITKRNPDGTIKTVTGMVVDITERKQIESEIRSLNAILEERVKERTGELETANITLKEEISQRIDAEQRLRTLLDEKMILLKEVHHRVKNNLQIINSLLNLQSRYISDEKTLAAIRESQNRIRAMSMVHEKLYQTEDISDIDLGEYIRFLAESLFQFYGAKMQKITLTTDIPDIHADINIAIPFGLIMNELISNSLKYAFPEGNKGEVVINIRREDHTLKVVYKDNGIGIPADLDWRNTRSLGLRLVRSLVEQLNGKIELDKSAGTVFSMVLQEKG